MTRAACLDVGSTWTKGALVDLGSGELLATAQSRTTAGSDVLEGVDAVLASLGACRGDEVRACSSAGGGLRLAVVGYERAVTAEAGHRVGLSAGARVVHVSAGLLDDPAALVESRPDVVLLVGGTDGGNAEVLLHNARRLAAAPLRAPVVVAGNVEARDEACGLLARRRRAVIPAANVLPRIGVLEPGPAREAIRGVFLRHVLGGKGLSRGPRFARLVRAATPDAVLTGVELLADTIGDVLVVDVGGATTDVYSAVIPDAEEASLRREVVEVPWRGRTVEGDLGVRWSAPGVVEAAVAERLLEPSEEPGLRAAAQQRAADPAYVPEGQAERHRDARLAALAATVALRRHGRAGRDLRGVRLVVGSGGVFRHAAPERLPGLLAPAVCDLAGGWRLPERAELAVDASYVLAAAGLLAGDVPQAAVTLLRERVQRVATSAG